MPDAAPSFFRGVMNVRRMLWIAALAFAPGTLALGAQTAPKDRWQIARSDGSYLWDLHLVRLSGDTLVVEQADSLVALPLGTIDELRMVQSFEQRGPAGQRSAVAGLAGADDTVVKLTLYTVEERRKLLEEILRARESPR